MRFSKLASPIGTLLIAGDDAGLRSIRFDLPARPAEPEPDWRRDDKGLALVIVQLEEYFAGARRQFDLPLAPEGTEFQHRVWEQLRTIPFGETRTYGELADQIGSPEGARAVGLANGSNPLPIVIPCHRVIGADGSLTGFGGGIERKRFLLEHEGAPLRGAGQASLF